MNDIFSKSIFNKLRRYLLLNLGLNFNAKQNKELFNKINSATKEFNFTDPHKFVQWLLETELTNQQIITLASQLTIGETYFLRENKSFEYLEYNYLLKLLEKRKNKDQHLRLWCAGCASGEEAYSIAIMLHKTIPNLKNWNISILATDINSTFLKKAEKGIYSKWSFRSTPKWYLEKYFKKIEDNKFQILPEIKEMVTFSLHNLAKNNYPSLLNNTNAMDIIFCRNVLIYFSPEGIRNVTNRLYNSLVDGGVFLVSAVEVSNFITPRFSKINYSGYTIYQKRLDKNVLKKNKWENSKINKNNVYKTYQVQKPRIKKPLQVEPLQQKQQKTTTVLQTKKVEKYKESEYDHAVVLFKQGLFDEAEILLTNLLETNKENYKPIALLLAKTKANLGKLEEAMTLCKKTIDKDKLNHNLYFLMASIRQEQGNEEEAVSLLNRAIYLNQNFVLAHFLLGNLSVKSGKKATGLKHYKNAKTILSKLNPDEILPESEGLTVNQFKEMMNTIAI